MNHQNVLKAITIMRRAAIHHSLSMATWQGGDNDSVVAATEEELHACGNTACFAGHIAVSPEFLADGGTIYPDSGMPVFGAIVDGYSAPWVGSESMARWLDIREGLAESLVFGDLSDSIDEEDDESSFYTDYSLFYKKPWDNVRAEDVIAKLALILKGELT